MLGARRIAVRLSGTGGKRTPGRLFAGAKVQEGAPAMAGYSGTPLARKLGIKADHRVALLGAPAGFADTLEQLPDGVTLHTDGRGTALFDVMVFFTSERAELAKRFGHLAKRLTPAGGLWIAWPKRASGVATDLTEDVVRNIGLDNGLVDNKVCAVDETWSGLRFVIRLRDRTTKKS
jgi:hypothetical protein